MLKYIRQGEKIDIVVHELSSLSVLKQRYYKLMPM
jgi:hypothetical protein